MIFKSHTRALIAEAEPFWIPKFVVRLFTTGMTTAAIATFLAGLPHTFDVYQVIFPLVVSIKWNVAVIAVRLCRIRPMHPAIVLFFDFGLWATLVLFTAYSVLQGTTLAEAAQTGDTGSGDPSLDSLLAKNPDAATASPIIIALSGFSGAAFIGHFILFVWAAVDWHTRRKREITSMAPGARVKGFQGWDWAKTPTEMEHRVGSRVALVREMSAATSQRSGAGKVYYAASDVGSRADDARFAPAHFQGWPIPPTHIDTGMERVMTPNTHRYTPRTPDSAMPMMRKEESSDRDKEAVEEVGAQVPAMARSNTAGSGGVVLGSTRSRRTVDREHEAP